MPAVGVVADHERVVADPEPRHRRGEAVRRGDHPAHRRRRVGQIFRPVAIDRTRNVRRAVGRTQVRVEAVAAVDDAHLRISEPPSDLVDLDEEAMAPGHRSRA